MLDAFDGVGRYPDLCGVGIVGLVGWLTPDYTHLHRDVPMYLLPVEALSQREAGFNYLIVSGDPLPSGGDFTRLSCKANTGFTPATRETICVYRRIGACAPDAGGRCRTPCTIRPEPRVRLRSFTINYPRYTLWLIVIVGF